MTRLPETCEPELVQARCGWMARTPIGHGLCIAVIERTQNQARDSFEHAFQLWQKLSDPNRPDVDDAACGAED